MARKSIYIGQPGSSSAQVGASSSLLITITAATVCNADTVARTLTVWKVASGGSVADAAMLIDALSVDAGTTVGLQHLVGHTLDANDEIHMQADTAATLTVCLSGDYHN